MGCDYCESIQGIGPKRAVALIQQYKNIETILQNIDTKKYPVPENWQYKEARELFVNPEVDKYSPSDVCIFNFAINKNNISITIF